MSYYLFFSLCLQFTFPPIHSHTHGRVCIDTHTQIANSKLFTWTICINGICNRFHTIHYICFCACIGTSYDLFTFELVGSKINAGTCVRIWIYRKRVRPRVYSYACHILVYVCMTWKEKMGMLLFVWVKNVTICCLFSYTFVRILCVHFTDRAIFNLFYVERLWEGMRKKTKTRTEVKRK